MNEHSFATILAKTMEVTKDLNDFLPNLEKHAQINELELGIDGDFLVQGSERHETDTVYRIPHWDMTILHCVNGITAFVSQDHTLGAQVTPM